MENQLGNVFYDEVDDVTSHCWVVAALQLAAEHHINTIGLGGRRDKQTLQQSTTLCDGSFM